MLGRLRRPRLRGGRSRWLLAGVLVVLAVGGPLASGGFATVDADRPLGMAVVDDELAYVGLDFAASVRSNRDGERLVTVTNNLDGSMTTTVELVETAATVIDFTATGTDTTTVTLASGASTDVLVDVDAGAHNTIDKVNVSVDATAGEAAVFAYREETNVTNPGGGNQCPGGPPCGGG